MVGLRSMNVTELAFHPVDHSSTGHSCLQSERLAQVHMRWVECQYLPTRSLMLDGILGFTETWISYPQCQRATFLHVFSFELMIVIRHPLLRFRLPGKEKTGVEK